MSRGRWFAVAALAAAGRRARCAITAGGIGKNLVYYWGPTELHAAGDKAVGASIRLGGLVAPGLDRDAATGASHVEFDVIDRPGGRVHVKCTGVPPQMFREQHRRGGGGHDDRGRLLRRPPADGVAQQRVPRPRRRRAVDVQKAMRTTQGLDERPKPPQP